MADIHALEPKLNFELVPLLTRLLKRAQEGELTAMAAVFLTSENGTLIAISDPHNEAVRLIGAVGTMDYRIKTRHDQGWDNG